MVKILDLFSGTQSVRKALDKMGFEFFATKVFSFAVCLLLNSVVAAIKMSTNAIDTPIKIIFLFMIFPIVCRF